MSDIKTFENYVELVQEVHFAILDAVKGSKLGASNQSMSAYINYDVYDEDEEFIETRTVRISDHSPRYNLDEIVLNIDVTEFQAEEIYDEDFPDEMIGIEVQSWRIENAIERAVKALTA